MSVDAGRRDPRPARWSAAIYWPGEARLGTGDGGFVGATRRTLLAPRTSSNHLERLVLPLVCVMLASCGQSDAHPPSLAIEPEVVVVSGSQTTQFTVQDTTPVVWGLDDVPANQTDQAAEFPLKVSENGRYLVDQRGQPWRIQADAAWLMSSRATPSEVEQYLDTRKKQGFNSFYLMAMVHPKGYGAAPNAPNNWRGDPPFAVEGDFSTAGATPESERYWQWIDWIVAQAAARNMVVMLSYTYLGWGGGAMGWYEEILNQPSQQSLFDWGTWLGSRYKDDANIIWFGLGDFAPASDSDGAARVVEIAKGIKAAGAPQPFMAEAAPPDSMPVEDLAFGPVLDINSFYGFGPEGLGAVYETADRSWRISPPKPAFMEEGTYEYENNWGHFSAKPWDTRRGRFWSVLGGAVAGDGFGSKDVWQWNDIPKSLDSPGAAYSSAAFALFASLPWWELTPSGTEAGRAGLDLVAEGQDTWGQLGFITSARTMDGNWLLAYAPVMEQGQRSFSIDMAAMRGPTRARWFDPESGNYLAVSDGYEYENSGSRRFTTPGSRSDGTDDWVLVLDGENDPACGSMSPSGVYAPPDTVPRDVVCEVTVAAKDDPSVSSRMRIVFQP